MSNHLPVVVQVLPELTANWIDQAMAERWVRLFPRAAAGDASGGEVVAADCQHR